MALRTGTPLPSFDGIQLWINDRPECVTPGGHRALIVHFWAVSCPACKANMPALYALRDEYASVGVRFVAVHSPRIPDDVNDTRVQEVATQIGVTEPCAVDNERVLADRFELGGIWPYYFLYDSNCLLKLRGAGGVGFRLVSGALRRLAAQP